MSNDPKAVNRGGKYDCRVIVNFYEEHVNEDVTLFKTKQKIYRVDEQAERRAQRQDQATFSNEHRWNPNTFMQKETSDQLHFSQ
jgi:hypothetical protein